MRGSAERDATKRRDSKRVEPGAHGFAWRNADFFAGPGIAADAGLARFYAEDAEFAQFDALSAAESALERLENSFDRLLRFGAADVGLSDYRIHDIQLDHTALQNPSPMLEASVQVVKAFRLLYTGTFCDYTFF